jgi:hypothetical protein
VFALTAQDVEFNKMHVSSHLSLGGMGGAVREGRIEDGTRDLPIKAIMNFDLNSVSVVRPDDERIEESGDIPFTADFLLQLVEMTVRVCDMKRNEVSAEVSGRNEKEMSPYHAIRTD